MTQRSRGFTLIELMIVVAIIGILVAVALPAYQDYLARSQVAEAFTMVEGAKTTVAEYGQTNGAYPGSSTTPSAASLGVTGRFGWATVTPDTGVITVKMAGAGIANANVADQTVTFTPPPLATSPTAFVFECTSTMAQKYLPKNCDGA